MELAFNGKPNLRINGMSTELRPLYEKGSSEEERITGTAGVTSLLSMRLCQLAHIMYELVRKWTWTGLPVFLPLPPPPSDSQPYNCDLRAFALS